MDPRATVLFIKTSPRRDSRSSEAADALARRVRAGGIRVAVADQRELPLVAAGLAREVYPPAIRDLTRRAEHASALVIAAPVHRGAVSGVARNLLELLRDSIAGTPTAVILAAGSSRAQLVGNAVRADLFLNFGTVAFKTVMVTPQDAPEALEPRLDEIARSILAACEAE